MAVQRSVLKPDVPPEEIKRKATLGKAMEYCAELAGYSYDKQLEDALNKHGCKIDKTQLSRWQSGTEGIKWDKLKAYMDVCGNDAPLIWMLHQLGYDLTSVRKVEPELVRELRLAREQNKTLLRMLVESQR